MSKREDQKIAALVKKNSAKLKQPTQDQSKRFDSTLRVRAEPESEEHKQFFKDMKRREF